MSKSKIDNRASTKPHSRAPTLIRDASADGTVTSSSDVTGEHGDKDNPLPEPAETASQAIPTPELLYMRRAALHMPMAPSGDVTASGKRRATAAPKGGLQTAVSLDVAPSQGDCNDEALPAHLAKNMPLRRRATLQVPSKLAMN